VIDHLVLRVIGLPVMQGFYCWVLGCTAQRKDPDMGLIQLRIDSSLIDLVPVDRLLGMNGGAAPGIEGQNPDRVCLAIAPSMPYRFSNIFRPTGFNLVS